jgi:hypothetical protein
VFNFVVGLLQEKEVTGVLGTGLQRDETCPMRLPVELGRGPTSVLGLLNGIVQQAGGLV